ncbi:DMT family transporter [Leucothrix arctica]|uniref:EamA family transporter n=1 Tax=Leucothrix arctica TaxID=1481894 RepID=A0A317CBG3_9GAMM|nr:DMT family transporter [Leucothrix arctica]PWQ95699.1 EamA family transporter [Leucothrix arctica]
MRDPAVNNQADIKQTRYVRTGLLLAAAGTGLFAMKSIFIKMAFQEGVDTSTLMTLRMLVALPFYLGMMFWLFTKNQDRKPLPTVQQWLTVFGLGFFGYYLASFLDIEGLNHITAQLERLTLYTYPLMTTILGWLFLKDVITKRIVLALVVSYAGIMLLYLHEASLEGADVTLGVLLVLGSALSFSCYIVFSKSYISQLGSRLFTSMAMLASAIYAFIHFAVTGHSIDDLFAITNMAWVYVFLLAIFSTLIPSFMVSEAIARIGPAKASIVGTAGPVFTIILAVLLLDEAFGWYHLGGMLLVMGGVSILGKK